LVWLGLLGGNCLAEDSSTGQTTTLEDRRAARYSPLLRSAGSLRVSVSGFGLRTCGMAKRIYVGNLPWAYGSSDLEALFAEFGEVASAEVMTDRTSGRSRGFGFVQMANDADMDAAIDALNGQDCNGRPLVVNEARERTSGGGGRG